jgi:hypothetical protein
MDGDSHMGCSCSLGSNARAIKLLDQEQQIRKAALFSFFLLSLSFTCNVRIGRAKA